MKRLLGSLRSLSVWKKKTKQTKPGALFDIGSETAGMREDPPWIYSSPECARIAFARLWRDDPRWPLTQLKLCSDFWKDRVTIDKENKWVEPKPVRIPERTFVAACIPMGRKSSVGIGGAIVTEPVAPVDADLRVMMICQLMRVMMSFAAHGLDQVALVSSRGIGRIVAARNVEGSRTLLPARIPKRFSR